jgi:hypothetical protein
MRHEAKDRSRDIPRSGPWQGWNDVTEESFENMNRTFFYTG